MLDLVPQRILGSIDYRLGHHSLFYPDGGPMNGQTARLEIVRSLIVTLRPTLLVEIGTFRGATTEWLAQFGPRVVSVEPTPRFHRFAELRLAAHNNVRLMAGKSIDALRQLAAEGAFAERKVLFYLNSRELAHLLLREELGFIFASCPSCLVVVDDFQVEDDGGYAVGRFGLDKSLTVDYLTACKVPRLSVFYPTVIGRRETGSRRGSVFLTADPEVARVLEAMPGLRPQPVPTDAGRANRSSERASAHAGRASKPRLEDITVCCVDCVQPELAIRALQISRTQCDFAAAVLFTHVDLVREGIEVRRVPRITSRAGYSNFLLKELHAHITTPFVLVIQWDGYVLDGARWEDGFREFDYIGAPWHLKSGPRVGNGGFSLRSRRLLEVVKDLPIPSESIAEDHLICDAWRSMLEERGIRFADVRTARRFSVEIEATEAPSFGFHCVYNFWRVLPADELEGVLNGMSPSAVSSRWLVVLALEYARQHRWREANLALARYERQLGTARTIEMLSEASRFVGPAAYEAIRHAGSAARAPR